VGDEKQMLGKINKTKFYGIRAEICFQEFMTVGKSLANNVRNNNRKIETSKLSHPIHQETKITSWKYRNSNEFRGE
jgi:hypothetical protein